MLVRSLTILGVALISTSCVHPHVASADPPGVRWRCAVSADTVAEAFADNLVAWALRSASTTGQGWREFRQEYNLPMEPTADLQSLVSIVRDPEICARAGRAYADDRFEVPYVYRVVVVAIGNRYVAINLNAVRRAGEFMLEAVMDQQFRVISWIGT
jgi:hypothetical protein